MLPILQETNEMEKLKQLNSILVKELKDSKNEIAKLKGENDILKEKYEEMRGDGIQRELDKLKEEISTDDEKTDKRLGLDRSVETLVKIKQEKERRTRHDQRSRTIGIFKH